MRGSRRRLRQIFSRPSRSPRRSKGWRARASRSGPQIRRSSKPSFPPRSRSGGGGGRRRTSSSIRTAPELSWPRRRRSSLSFNGVPAFAGTTADSGVREDAQQLLVGDGLHDVQVEARFLRAPAILVAAEAGEGNQLERLSFRQLTP